MNKKVSSLFVSGVLAASITGTASAQNVVYSPELAEKCKNAITAATSTIPEECRVFIPGQMPQQGYQQFQPQYQMQQGYTTSTPGYPMPTQRGDYQPQNMPQQGYPQDFMRNAPQMQPGMPGGFQGGQGQMPQQMQGGFQNGGGQMMQGIGEEQLKQMKRGVKSMESNIKRIEKRMGVLETKGVKIDSAAKDAVSQIKDIITKVNAAQKAEDVDSVDMGDFGDLMQTINESMQKAEMGAQFPSILKEADRELTRQAGYLKKADAKAALLDVNIGTLLQNWHALVDQMTQIRDTAKTDFAVGNTEDAINALRDDFFGKMEELGQKRGAYEMLSNMTRMLRAADQELSTAGRTADRLEKKGEDVAKLREYIADAKTKLADIRAMAKEADIDQEKLIEEIQSFMEAKGLIGDEIAAISGQVMETNMPQIPGLQNFKPFEASQGFDMFMQGQMPGGPTQGGTPGGMMQQQPMWQMMPQQQPVQQMMPQQQGGQGVSTSSQQGNARATMESTLAELKAKVAQLVKEMMASQR